jgi:hypothetical protein
METFINMAGVQTGPYEIKYFILNRNCFLLRLGVGAYTYAV